MRENVYSRLRYAFLISCDDNGFCVAYEIKRWKQNRLMKRTWCHRYWYNWINWLFPFPPSIVEFLYFRDKHHQHGYFAIENNALVQLDSTSAASNDLDVRIWKRNNFKNQLQFLSVFDSYPMPPSLQHQTYLATQQKHRYLIQWRKRRKHLRVLWNWKITKKSHLILTLKRTG